MTSIIRSGIIKYGVDIDIIMNAENICKTERNTDLVESGMPVSTFLISVEK